MILDDDIIKKHGVMFAAIYAVVSTNPNITQAEIATLCHTSLRTVQRTLDELQQLHYIEIKVNKPKPNTYENILHSHPTPTRKKPFGEFGHVLLSEYEYQKLIKDVNNDKALIDEYIKKLDEYMEIHPEKHYAAHQKVISNWIADDKENQRKKLKPPKGAKYWYDGKTYGDLINAVTDETQKQYYLKMIVGEQRNEIATMPLEELASLNEYLALTNIFEGDE